LSSVNNPAPLKLTGTLGIYHSFFFLNENVDFCNSSERSGTSANRLGAALTWHQISLWVPMENLSNGNKKVDWMKEKEKPILHHVNGSAHASGITALMGMYLKLLLQIGAIMVNSSKFDTVSSTCIFQDPLARARLRFWTAW
jgi:hypothetical protein